MSEHYALEVSELASGEIRLLVSGELDLEAAPMLLDAILCSGLAHEPGVRIVVDLQNVTFLDSSGLAALVEAHHRIALQEQELLLGSLSERVARILSIAGVDQVIPIDDRPADESRAS